MKIIQIIIIGILTSFYLYPIKFVILPDFNTKRMLAVAGFLLLLYELGRNRNTYINKNFIILSLSALFVSFIGFISTTLNNTSDFTYTTYIGSMWVWLCAAYFMIKCMKAVHGEKLNIWVICNYISAVAVSQCFEAILIARSTGFKAFVDTYFDLNQEFMDNVPGIKRRYGIGAGLDTAGTIFSATIILLATQIKKAQSSGHKSWIPYYIFSVIFIALFGNIISRTTSVGLIIAVVYGIYQCRHIRFGGPNLKKTATSWMFALGLLLILGSSYMYNNDDDFRKDLRFGFEGFFSLVEHGKWEVSSNDRLATMYVYPDNLKTWIIGDGYFNNPKNTDPYYIGEITGGYYKGSDVGYIRFIFYFGIIGLSAFSLFFFKCTQVCISEYPNYRLMFLMLLLLNFIVWLKVSTDMFIIFAPFLCLAFITDPNKEDQYLIT